jgi:putative tricarboxylic transport membrane protein
MEVARVRRHLFLAAAAAAAVAVAAPSAPAQTFPSKPIELVVHTAPGGGTDLIARLVADIMMKEKLVNQPVNVINRVGGGGAIAYTYIKSKRGEPHTVMSVATLAMLNQVVRPELGLGLENYTPLAFLAQDPQAVMVSAESPYKTMKDLIDAARRDPNSLVASIASPGGTARMLLWLLERETGARVKVVSNKSGADAILQVMGGHTHLSPENIAEGYAAVESKKLRVLAVSSLMRLPVVPDTPTLKELGYDINIGTGRGFAMPAGVPKEAAAHMEGVLKGVFNSAAWKEHAARNFYENLWMGSAEYTKYLAERSGQVREFQQGIGLLKP